MKLKKHILSLILGVFVLPVSSCGPSFFDGFFSENMKWESEGKDFIMLAQGIHYLSNYGKIKINGSYENVIFSMYYDSMFVYRNGDEGTQRSMSVILKRISSNGFLDFTDDSFTGSVTENNTGDTYWDDWEGTFTGSSFTESELDAKYYLGTTFENDNLDIMFGFNGSNDEAFEYKLSGSYGDDQIEFVFGDNKDFTITDSSNNTASGTYTSRYDGMDLTFTSNNIFDIEGNTIALESTNTMDFINE